MGDAELDVPPEGPGTAPGDVLEGSLGGPKRRGGRSRRPVASKTSGQRAAGRCRMARAVLARVRLEARASRSTSSGSRALACRVATGVCPGAETLPERLRPRRKLVSSVVVRGGWFETQRARAG